MIGDILVDGDKVTACAAGGDGAVMDTAGAPAADDDEVDMARLMSDISSKIAKADETLRAKAKKEEQEKMKFEALLKVFKAVSKDSELAIPAIASAALKLLDAEYVNLYFVCETPGEEKKLRLAFSAKAGFTEGDEEEAIYSETLSFPIGSGVVGRLAVDVVAEKEDRTASVFNQDGRKAVVFGSDALSDDIDAAWAEDPSLGPSKIAAIGSFISCAISHVPESKSMLTEKTDAELKQVFEDVDDDNSGYLDREELVSLGQRLGKRLTTRELEQAMLEMDDDESGKIDLEEFSNWWKKSYQKLKLGNVIGVIQAINKQTHSYFEPKDGELLQGFLSQIGHVFATYVDKANLALAAASDEYLQTFHNQSQSAALARTNKALQGGTSKLKGKVKQIIFARRLSVEYTDFSKSPMGKMAITPLRRFDSQLLTGLNLPALEKLQQWSFPCLNYDQGQLAGCVVMIFEDIGLMQHFKLTESVVNKYAYTVFERYNAVPYHNLYHAFCVFQGCYWALLTASELKKGFTKLDQFSILVAALGHDLDHGGYNNDFHVKSGDDLALCYNDRSPLENKHARLTFEVSKMDGCDIFGTLSADDRQGARMSIIDMILHTDMKYHGEHMTSLENKTHFSTVEAEDRNFWLGVVLHTCDIANVAFKWDECYKWARMVIAEFKAQYAKEVEAGLPPTGFLNVQDDIYNSVHLPNVAKMQAGFGGFMVKPCLQKVARHIPIFEELVDTLESNIEIWQSMIPKEGVADEDLTRLPPPAGMELECMNRVKDLIS